MNYLKWLLLAIPDLLSTPLCWILAPFVVPFADAEGWLPKSLAWFQTPDNSLDGDKGWVNEHWQWRYRLPQSVCTYVGRVGWLWRNPMYGYTLSVSGAELGPHDLVTVKGDIEIQDKPDGRSGWCFVTIGGYWNFYWVRQWGSSARCQRLNIGWKLKQFAEPRNSASFNRLYPVVAQYAFRYSPAKAYGVKP